MQQPTITLSDATGTIHSYTVPIPVLVQVFQLMHESPDCEVIEKLAIPEPSNVVEFEPPRPTAAPVDVLDLPHTIREGTKAGYVEILFDAAPDDVTRTTLKNAGFRWAFRRGVWYGLEADLPEAYRVIDVERPEAGEDTGGNSEPETPTQPPAPSAPASDDAAFMSSLAGLMQGA